MKRPVSKQVALVLSAFFLTSLAAANDLESLLQDETAASTTSSKLHETKPFAQLAQAITESIKTSNGKVDSEQNAFLRKLEEGAWEQALILFGPSLGHTRFAQSANGVALKGLLQFQSQLSISGLETLFRIEKPQEITRPLRIFWDQVAKGDHPVWKMAEIKWRTEWKEVFSPQIGFKPELMFGLSQPTLEQLEVAAGAAPVGSPEANALHWQLTLAYAQKDKLDLAGKVLAQIIKSQKLPARPELIHLTAARLLFQNGHFDAAIKYYERISRNSEYWPIAQEEMAWAYLRKGEPQNAVALGKTLVDPVLLYQVTSESYLVTSLAQLRVCDYPGVLASLRAFKTGFQGRHQNLSNLLVQGDTSEVQLALGLLSQSRIDTFHLGSAAQKLPRLLVHDEVLFQAVQKFAQVDLESQISSRLYSQSLALTGLQGELESQKKSLELRRHKQKAIGIARVQELARYEINEIQSSLKKMHIIEAELLSQVGLAERLVQQSTRSNIDVKMGSTGAKGSDLLRFPLESEKWLDELGNIKVDIKKACHAREGKKL